MSEVPQGRDSNQDLFGNLERLIMADPVEAIRTATQELAAIDDHATIGDRLIIRRLMAMAYAHTGQFDRSLEICDEAIALDAAGQAPVETARVRLASMQPLAHLGRIEDAITAGNLALAALEAEGTSALAGRAALNLGSIYAMTGHHGEALTAFDRAIELLATDAMLAGQIETNRGTSSAALDRFAEAETAFSRAGSHFGEDLPWASAVVEGNLADLAARQGEINRSLRHFEASRRHLELDEALGDLGRLEAEEAEVLSMSGLADAAAAAFVRAIEILEDHGTPADLATAQIGYGHVLVEIGSVDAAESLLDSLALIAPDENPDLHQRYLKLGARIAIDKGEYGKAREAIAAGIAALADRPIQRLGWALLHARTARLAGDNQETQAILAAALADARMYEITP